MDKDRKERIVYIPESVIESHIKDIKILAREVRSMAL